MPHVQRDFLRNPDSTQELIWSEWPLFRGLLTGALLPGDRYFYQPRDACVDTKS